MYQPRRWTLPPPDPRARELADRLKTSQLIAQVLLNRGVSELDDCVAFLRPNLKCLHDPALLPNLTPAAQRIARAARDKEKIVIYGDYDVDGITAVAILWHALKLLGADVEYYIPHRIEEGYGLNSDAVAQLCDAGAKLIVTVDCGVTALGPARIARDRGVDLIITDHHEFKHEDRESRIEDSAPSSILNPPSSLLLPDCFAVVHPRLAQNSELSTQNYPNPHLCGAGVAFKLAWGIGQAINGAARVSEEFKNFLLDATALAALGTIADVVPLVGENRVLAHFGLSGLMRSRLNGIRALIASAGLDGKNLDSYHVGFLLAPRLNASGRMGHAHLAVEMLTTASPTRAAEIAQFLEQQNRQRQSIERKILEEALAQVEQLGFNAPECRALVLGSESWHAGVIGIVASRLVDRFQRPTVMVSLANGIGQGSGRSIPGFHLARALEACSEHLDTWGGHEMAAGLKVQKEKFEGFRQAFCAHAASIVTPDMLTAELKLECLAELNHFTQALVNDLNRLGPFGHGNRKPTLCVKQVELAGLPRRVGKTGDHLQLYIRQGGTHMKCIAFGGARLLDKLQPGITMDIAVQPQLNEFNGRVSVELEVKDVQFG